MLRNVRVWVLEALRRIGEDSILGLVLDMQSSRL